MLIYRLAGVDNVAGADGVWLLWYRRAPMYSNTLFRKHSVPQGGSLLPVWFYMTPANVSEQWREDWALASVINSVPVTDPTI